MRHLVVLLAALITLLGPSAHARDEQPAMWVVEDEDSTIYLFGTIHLLRPELVWFDGEVLDAFARSEELWLEIADLGEDPSVQGLVVQLGFEPAGSLSSKLDAKHRKQLAEGLAMLGMTPDQVETMRPWLAALTLSTAPLAKDGLDPAAGADHVLQGAANLAGKPVRGFETTEQQVRMLAGLSETAQLKFLTTTLDGLGKMSRMMDRLSKDWARGETRWMTKIVVDQPSRRQPEFHQRLLVDRNVVWTDTLLERLRGSGTSFVAVGAGHLLGDQGVPAMLGTRGVKVRRLEPSAD